MPPVTVGYERARIGSEVSYNAEREYRKATAVDHTGDALVRGCGEGPHAVGFPMKPRRFLVFPVAGDF